MRTRTASSWVQTSRENGICDLSVVLDERPSKKENERRGKTGLKTAEDCRLGAAVPVTPAAAPSLLETRDCFFRQLGAAEAVNRREVPLSADVEIARNKNPGSSASWQ